MANSRLPIVLVTGFLGAGKTTFMRHLIEDSARRGIGVGVVINEFGVADIDGSLLRDSGAEMLGALSGGCACCSSQDEMIYAMLQLGLLPQEKQPDVVLLESSGLADPLVMLDALTVAALLPWVRVASLISVVDASRLPELRAADGQMAPLLRRQVALADLVVVNKIDVAFRGEKAGQKLVAEAILREVNASARLEWAQGGAIELDALWARVLQTERALAAPGAGQAVHGQAQTLVVPMPRPMLREKLEVALRLDEGVWRVKGFVRLVGENDLFLVQLSGAKQRQLEISRFEASDLTRLPPAELVFIGPSLDKNALWHTFNGAAPLLSESVCKVLGCS